MIKLMKSFAILAVAAIVLVSASAVYAQATGPGTGSKRGGMGNSTGANGGMLGEPLRAGDDGLLHDYFIAAFAEALEVEDLEKRLEDGETMAEIALSTGLTLEDFKALMTEVRTTVLEQALADGVITKEQAEWFASRGNRMAQGAGMAQGTGMRQGAGMRGKGQGMYGTGDCIND